MSSRQSRTLIIILVCSITINLLLIGGIGTHFAFVSGSFGRPFPSHLGWIASTLDEDTQEKLRPILLGYAEKARPARREMAQAQQLFESALRKDPLNEAEITLALNQLQRISLVNQTNMHQQMIAIMRVLKPEERKKALRFMHHRKPRHMRERRGQPPHDLKWKTPAPTEKKDHARLND